MSEKGEALDTNTNQDEVDLDAHETQRATGKAGNLPTSETPPTGEGGNPDAERPRNQAGTQTSTGSG